ncbi:MAG: DUF4367 domain-containing protein, partial [Hungatella sp.]
RDDQLEAEFDRAAAEPDDPRLQPPPDEFDKILARLNTEQREAKKIIRIKRVLKPITLVAILGITLAISGIGASGKRNLDYLVTKKEGKGTNIHLNTAGNLIHSDLEEQAYQKIQEELGMDVLELLYKPVGMEFKELTISLGTARMEFEYQGELIQLLQMQSNTENSRNVVSDCEEYKIIYNNWIKCDIPIYRKVLEDDKIEYLATIENSKSYYCFDGIMEEEEFMKIIEKMRFYE